MNVSKGDALISLRPGSEWVLRGDELEWLDQNQTQPTETEIQAELLRLQSEQLWNELRQERNRRLAETDYLALSDAILSEDMQIYRQALRDLPANTTDPANPDWPVKPGA